MARRSRTGVRPVAVALGAVGLAAETASGKATPEALAAGRAALAAAGKIATHATEYSPDPADHGHVRRLVAAAVEALPPGP